MVSLTSVWCFIPSTIQEGSITLTLFFSHAFCGFFHGTQIHSNLLSFNVLPVGALFHLSKCLCLLCHEQRLYAINAIFLQIDRFVLSALLLLLDPKSRHTFFPERMHSLRLSLSLFLPLLPLCFHICSLGWFFILFRSTFKPHMEKSSSLLLSLGPSPHSWTIQGTVCTHFLPCLSSLSLFHWN